MPAEPSEALPSHVRKIRVSTSAFERISRIMRKSTSVKFFVSHNQQWFESHPLRQPALDFSELRMLELGRRVLGEKDPTMTILLYNLGALAGISDRTDEAITLLNQAIDAGLPPGAAENIERIPISSRCTDAPGSRRWWLTEREVAKTNKKAG